MIKRNKLGQFIEGQQSPHWKGGKTKWSGWWFIWKPNHPKALKLGYVKQAILIAEKKIERFLKPNETAHHINKIRDDDRPENLQVMTIKQHKALHLLENSKFIIEQKKKGFFKKGHPYFPHKS